MNKKLEGAFEALEVLDKTITPLLEPVLARYEDDLSNIINANYFVLKETLLKAQENEKEIAKYKQLEKDLGCPLDVRLWVNCNTVIYDEEGNEYSVEDVYKDNFICYNGQCDDFGCDYEFTFNWSDYKKTWWLKKDKEE